jgi:peptidoglycan/LPS O-acetylase OafA/YrhL
MKINITRLYWLDILRGIAALSIVLWHWQHFFMLDSFEETLRKGTLIDRTQYPLYNYLRPFYGQGWRAVELFFTLSGFIFFWLYSEKINAGLVNVNKYLLLRISRLYPLHILTFLIVFAGQLWIKNLEGHYFIYTDYSFITAVKNLTLTYTWFSSSFSFNGPSWSVSVEMFLYLIFFLLCYLKLNKWWYALLLICVGYYLKSTSLNQIGSGIMSFFIGGIVYYIFDFAINKLNKRFLSLLAILTFTIIVIGSIVWKYLLHYQLPENFFEFFIFPAIVLSMALLESSLGPGIGKKISFIGDLSYSSYLIHFPLQLFFLITCHILNYQRDIFYEPITLLLFYVILIFLSFVSFHYYEKPVQNLLRGKRKN